MTDPTIEAGVDDVTPFVTELQALADAVAGVTDEAVTAELAQDLRTLIAWAQHASGPDGSGELQRIRGWAATLRPRLTRLGEAPAVSPTDMPLRQVADLVHRLRVELSTIVETQASVAAYNVEDRRELDPD
jgi:hypothetical protein